MLFDAATLASNISNIAVQQTAQQIQDEITSKVFWGLIEFIFAALAGIGVAKSDLKEIKGVLAGIGAILGILGSLSWVQALLLAMSQASP